MNTKEYPASTNGPAPLAALPARERSPGFDPAVGDAEERTVPVVETDPPPNQPRKEFDPERDEELKASLHEHGQLNAIIVYRDPATRRYCIIAGERRWRAAKALGWTTIRARILTEPPDEAKCRFLMLVDNDSRTDLSDIERGVAYAEIISLTGCSARELAQKVGKNVSTVTRAVQRAQGLSVYLRERVQAGTLPPSIAQELLALPSDDARHAIARQYPDPLKTRAEVIAAVKAAKSGHSAAAPSGFSCEECGVKIALS